MVPQFQLIFLLPWVASIAAVVLYHLLGLERCSGFGAVLFLTSALVMGMAHGAYDVKLAKEQSQKVGTSPFIFYLGYLALFCLVVLGWRLYPIATMGLFLALSVMHWGTADFSFFNLKARERWILGLGRGAVVFASLFYFSSGEVAQILDSITGSDVLGSYVSQSAFGTIIAALIFQTGALGLLFTRERSFSVTQLIETCLIVVIFALLPALLALFVYFVFFHSFRHLLRLASFQSAKTWNSVNNGLLQLVRLHRETAIICLLSLAGGLLWAQIDQVIWSPYNLSIVYLKLLAAFTLPHALWIARLDIANAPQDWLLPYPTSHVNYSFSIPNKTI